MSDQRNSSQSKRTFDVPLGWLAFVIGTLLLLGWVVTKVGLIHAEPPAFLYPTGVALFVCGYVACFALPRLCKRVEKLEERLDALTKETTAQKKPSDQP